MVNVSVKDSLLFGTLRGLFMETPHRGLDLTPDGFLDAIRNYTFYTYNRRDYSIFDAVDDLITRETHFYLRDIKGYDFDKGTRSFVGLSKDDYDIFQGLVLQAFVNCAIDVLTRKGKLDSHCLEVCLKFYIEQPVETPAVA